MDRTRDLFSNPVFHILIVGVLAGILLFSNLDKGGLSGYDDAIFAYESRQMVQTADWLTIRANGFLHFDYLPMFYWMEAVSMSILGFTDFAAKFPAALCGLILIIITYFIARELTDDPVTAVISAWVLMLTQYFMKYATHAMSDVPFAMFFSIALYFYLKGWENRRYFLIFGLAVALAIMTRTILGLIPLGIGLLHLALMRQFAALRSKELIIGVIIAIGLPAILYLTYFSIFGHTFLEGHFSFIWQKTVSDGGLTLKGFVAGLVEYPYLLVKLYEPWFFIAMLGLYWKVKEMLTTRDRSATFLVIWVCFVILPFSFVSAKILRYIMPVFPALAILAAIPLSYWLQKFMKPTYRVAAFGLLCLGVLAIPLFSSPRYRAEPVVAIAPAIISNSHKEQRVILYTNGVLHHDVLNQLIWYTDRLYYHVGDLNELWTRLKSEEPLVFVVDKKTFEGVVAPSGEEVEIVGVTNEYVCFRTQPTQSL